MEPYRPRPVLPALDRAEPTRDAPVSRPRAERAMCLVDNGTWLLVHTPEAAPLRDGRWAARIQWNVDGKTHDGWFAHDPERLLPVVPGEPFPELRKPGA